MDKRTMLGVLTVVVVAAMFSSGCALPAERAEDRLDGSVAKERKSLQPARDPNIDNLPADPYETLVIGDIELTEEELAEFDKTWDKASSWGVGPEAENVRNAKAKLGESGAKGLKYLTAKFGTDYSLARDALGTAVRGFGPGAIDVLVSELDTDKTGKIVNILYCLSNIRHKAAADALVAYAEREAAKEERPEDLPEGEYDPRYKANGLMFSAIWYLRSLGDSRCVALMAPFAYDEAEIRRTRYCVTLEYFKPQKGFENLYDLLGDELFSVRYPAQEALEAIGKPAVGKLIRLAADREDVIVTNHAIMALGNIGDEKARNVLTSALSSEEWTVRGNAVEALSKLDGLGALSVFEKKLAAERHPFVLRKIREARVRPAQVAAAEKKLAEVQESFDAAQERVDELKGLEGADEAALKAANDELETVRRKLNQAKAELKKAKDQGHERP